jgi:hypothetical protein
MTDAYDLRSNLKGKPGSQGTLFQVHDKGLLNPQQRWPQGYTPERLNTVRDATRDISFRTYAGDPQAPHRQWEHLDREHFAKTVARTTVPAEDLQGLRGVNADHGKDNYAEYRVAKREIGWGIRKPEADGNLIHEIGHHVDNMRSREADPMSPAPGTTAALAPGIAKNHAQQYWTDKGNEGRPNTTVRRNVEAHVNLGVGEAVADNYYVKHYRGPGRKAARPTQGRYEDIQGPEGINNYPGYRDVRPGPHMGPQFSDDRLF